MFNVRMHFVCVCFVTQSGRIVVLQLKIENILSDQSTPLNVNECEYFELINSHCHGISECFKWPGCLWISCYCGLTLHSIRFFSRCCCSCLILLRNWWSSSSFGWSQMKPIKMGFCDARPPNSLQFSRFPWKRCEWPEDISAFRSTENLGNLWRWRMKQAKMSSDEMKKTSIGKTKSTKAIRRITQYSMNSTNLMHSTHLWRAIRSFLRLTFGRIISHRITIWADG